VRPGPDRKPLFYELMRGRGPFCFYAFDLLWLDGSDLRARPLMERKELLRKLLSRGARALLYVEHVACGTDLFRVICESDMEGVVANQRRAGYTPDATTWVKIKNRQYSQAVGRADFSIAGNRLDNARLPGAPSAYSKATVQMNRQISTTAQMTRTSSNNNGLVILVRLQSCFGDSQG
jgi:ATP-dependent DNA ligase